ncbi:MAG: hypothetical protein ACYC2T_14245 [Bacillota bacterium]
MIEEEIQSGILQEQPTTHHLPHITFNRPGVKYRLLGTSSAYPDARYSNPLVTDREVPPLIIPDSDRDNSGLL